MDSKTEFTQLLFELTKKQNLSLVESLEIMSKFQKKGAVEFAAKHILECLNQGLSFSGALKTCKEIEFDDLYISFVSFAEKTGHFGETCEFLYFRCKRKHENLVQIFEACLYPVFVDGVYHFFKQYLVGTFGFDYCLRRMYVGCHSCRHFFAGGDGVGYRTF